MSTEVDDFLSHVGVKGMHWGKRKSGPTTEAKPGKEVASKGPIDKTKLKAARKEIYSQVGESMHKPSQRVLSGAAIASSLISGGSTGSIVIGAQMMRGAGFSKGKTIATAALGGAPGAILMIELKARKMARE